MYTANSPTLEEGEAKDIGEFSVVSFRPGVMGPWKFHPSEGHFISTDEHPGLLTIRASGADEDIKGTIGKPLPLSEYPPIWEFETNLLRSSWAKRGGKCSDAIGLNVALTFSDPSSWPKDMTKRPENTHSFQLFLVHLAGELGGKSKEGKFMVWGRGDLGTLGKVIGGQGWGLPEDKILGDWGIPTYDVGDDQHTEGPASTDAYLLFRLLSPTKVFFGVRFSKQHTWYNRVIDVSNFGNITGVWEVGPIISGPSWITKQWPGTERPVKDLEIYIGFCDFRYIISRPSIEHFSKDFNVPGFIGGGYQTEFHGLLTETWSHPGYLTWTLRGVFNYTGVETVVDYGEQAIALSKYPKCLPDGGYRLYFPLPWEVEVCFIAPDDSIPWNFFMNWRVLNESGEEVALWHPGVVNIPGEGHFAGQVIADYCKPGDPTVYVGTDFDNYPPGWVRKVYVGGDFGPNFPERVPESILAHKPLYLLLRVIDSRHLQMGVKANPEDTWTSTPVWECPFEIVSLGDSCFSTYTGIKGAPAYQQFLIDYWHCRQGVSLDEP